MMVDLPKTVARAGEIESGTIVGQSVLDHLPAGGDV